MRPMLVGAALAAGLMATGGSALAQAPIAPAAEAPAEPAAPPPVPAPAPPADAPAQPAVPEDPSAGGPLPLVAIDPGHGGRDRGAVGRLPAGSATGLPSRRGGTRIYEKDVNLDVARRLDGWLRGRGYPTVMTRTTDKGGADRPYRTERADLRARVAVANKAGADLFVSIHANAFTPRNRGTETFRFHATSRAGRLLARSIHEEVVFRLGLPDRGVKPAGFYVLKHTAMPAVLLESAFLSNRRDVLELARPDFRQQVAEGVGAGIERYLRSGGPAEAGPAAAPEELPIRYWVTAGAFRRSAQARLRERRVEALGLDAVVRRRHSGRLGRDLYYVVTGRFALLENAKEHRDELRRLRLPGRVAAAEPPAGTAEGRARP